MAEQSGRGSVRRVHQFAVALNGRGKMRFRRIVTPELVVATTEPDHQYSRLLYEAMPGVSVIPAGAPDYDLARRLGGVDLLHLAWPEYWPGLDPEATKRAVAQIRAAGVRIVWTQHNLLPHRDRSTDAQRVYSLWAEAADGVIHHSVYGKRVALGVYSYPRARHYVIPHGHSGTCFPKRAPDRTSVEAEEGWPHAEIRLGIIGEPRREKPLQAVVEAFCRTDREDIQLVARLSPDIRVPDDPRFITHYGGLSTDHYYRRLTAIDGVILPFTGDTMVTTGTAFDCIGGGIAAIASPWGFLTETFGEAAIWVRGFGAELTGCLDSLTSAKLLAGRNSSRRLQKAHDWQRIGEQTIRAFQEVASN